VDELLREWAVTWHWTILLLVMAGSVAVLGRGADWLVDEAVAVSLRLRLSRAVIGATVVSLGTTTPETAVSVLAAVAGNSGLALGNAVGSIICDTGLILGIACVLQPLPINRPLVQRQGRIQIAAAVLLVLACIPWSRPAQMFVQGGQLPQLAGGLFLLLLLVYLIWSIRAAGAAQRETQAEATTAAGKHFLLVFASLCGAIAVVVVSSSFLIATATELAARLHVPPSIVAATLVAFGTSLPEFMIAVTAARKGHGELAMGNVIGADILNVLFVTGAAAAVTRNGLRVEPHFFQLQFPAMLFVLAVFRLGVWRRDATHLSRRYGMILLGAYVLVTVISYLHR
jgi:cation:H+ antiporter